MKKKFGFGGALIVLLLAFFFAQVFALTSFKSTGKSLEYTQGKTVIYDVSFKEDGERLDAVYIKVGSIYNSYGSDVSLTVKYSTSKTSSSFTTFAPAVTLGNVFSSKDGLNGANYNWIAYGENRAAEHKKDIARISFTATHNLELCEIVAFSDRGNPVTLAVNSASAFKDAAKNTLDKQNSFVGSGAARYNFTQEEAYALTSAHTMLGGREFYENSKYNLNGDYNYLATLVVSPFISVFGPSTFALRLPSILASTAMLAAVYLLTYSLLKKQKYAFMTASLFAIGGLATTVGTMGAPYALVACAVVYSAYFMHRFYTKGISSVAPIKGGLNVLFSGMFIAFAAAMDGAAVIPALGIIALFVLGMVRQNKAKALALAKVGGVEIADETDTGETIATETLKKTAKVKADYAYKNRIAVGFMCIGALLFGFFLLLLSGVFAYSAGVKIYDEIGNQQLGFLTIVWRALLGSCKNSNVTEFTAANAVNVFAWFIPFKAATVYDGVSAATNGYLAQSVWLNPVVCVASLSALIFSVVKVSGDIVLKKSDKESLRLRRTFFILLGGLALTMISASVKGNVSMLSSYAFSAFYIAFVPLAVFGLEGKGARIGKCKTNVVELVYYALLTLAFFAFVLSIAGAYGFSVTTPVSKCFTWMNIYFKR